MVFRSIPYDYALAGHHRRCTGRSRCRLCHWPDLWHLQPDPGRHSTNRSYRCLVHQSFDFCDTASVYRANLMVGLPRPETLANSCIVYCRHHWESRQYRPCFIDDWRPGIATMDCYPPIILSNGLLEAVAASILVVSVVSIWKQIEGRRGKRGSSF